MAESETQKRVNHHCIKNEACSKNGEKFVIEPERESPKDCAGQKKEHTLKNIEGSKDPGRWIDNAEMEYMIKHPHPYPKECKNS
jgi:hypothetical protein